MTDVPPPPPPGAGSGPDPASNPGTPPPAPQPQYDAPQYQAAPPPGGASGSGSNGMAVAALVLGILTFVCLGPIAGVLAIVFGILGLSKAKESGVGKGMSVAGIVLGAVGSVISVIVLVVLLVAAGETADDIADDIAGTADPDIYEIETGQCEVDELGFASFTGTITNTSDETKNFTINAEFRNPGNDALIESSSDIVLDLAAGDRAEWTVLGTSSDVTQVDCVLVDVENFFN